MGGEKAEGPAAGAADGALGFELFDITLPVFESGFLLVVMDEMWKTPESSFASGASGGRGGMSGSGGCITDENSGEPAPLLPAVT